MNWIKKILAWLLEHNDRVLHFFVMYVWTLTMGLFTPYWFVLITGVLIACGKEVYDKVSGGTWDKYDLLADGIGMGGATIFLLLNYAILNL